MKKTLLRSLVVVLIVAFMASFSFVGCKAEAAEEVVAEEGAEAVEEVAAEDGAKPFEGVTLSILANSHEPMLKANKWSVDVMKEKFGITIEIDEEPYGTEYDKAMSNFIAHTGAYDIIVGAHQWTGGWADPGFIIPLDDYIANDPDFDQSAYVQKAYEINTEWNGQQYGLPFNMEGRLMFYRKDIFEQEGLEVPTTTEEWLETVKYLAAETDTPACYMYGAEQAPAYPHEYYWGKFDWDSYNTINGYWDADTHQNIMDEELFAESLKFWADAKQYFPSGVEAYNLPEAYQYYVDGKGAMTEVWPLTLYGMLLDPVNEEIRKNTGVANIAYGKPMSGGWFIAITGDCDNKDAAWEYIKYMTKPENDTLFFAEFGKGPSAKDTFADSALEEKYGEWLENQAAAMEECVSCGKISTMADYYGGDFYALTTQAMIGDLDPYEAAAACVEEMDKLLERAGYPQE